MQISHICGLLTSALFALTACSALPDAQTGVSGSAAPLSASLSPAPWIGAPGVDLITQGGSGGRIVKVTTLESKGPGSLREAVSQKGPRLIVFEVGGVIDLAGDEIRIKEPFVTIAGQTAPSPGVTLIKGGLVISGHDVIVQHLRIRPGDLGEAPMSGRDIDAVTTQSAQNVIVDHCSLSWATDENLSASGPRFTGKTPDEWRAGTSRSIVFSHNIIAEGLANSTHAKGEHSKGSLIHDNVSSILIYGNLYAHNMERSPLFKGGVRGAIVNNLIYNPGKRAIHYNLQSLEWDGSAYEAGKMDVIGNVYRAGPSTAAGLPLVMIGGEGDLDLHVSGNRTSGVWGEKLPLTGRYTTGPARIVESRAPLQTPSGLQIMDAASVEAYVLKSAGARPWDRDAHDVRVIADTAEGRGRIIDSQTEVGGYPVAALTRRAFDPSLWDLSTLSPAKPEALDSGAKSRGT